jgi:flavin reductase (DIM6/NTAB) family NADH-FMN oxidoreductase RutF
MVEERPHGRLRRPVVDPERELAAALRSALGRFATGVAVVTCDSEEGRRGATVNSFTSVSLRPALILVSIAKSAKAHAALQGRPFAVNVLGAEQEALARRFAGAPSELAVPWEEGTHAPRLRGVLAYLECTPWRDYDGGDHTLFLGEVADFAYRGGDALGYHAGRFITVAEPQFGHEDVL